MGKSWTGHAYLSKYGRASFPITDFLIRVHPLIRGGFAFAFRSRAMSAMTRDDGDPSPPPYASIRNTKRLLDFIPAHPKPDFLIRIISVHQW
jgi:hypothetical protein